MKVNRNIDHNEGKHAYNKEPEGKSCGNAAEFKPVSQGLLLLYL